MNIAEWSVRNNRFILAVVLIFICTGLYTYQNIPRLEDAEVEVPIARIITYFPGAAPDKVESLVTDKIEQALRVMPEADHVWSQSMTGMSIVFMQLDDKYFKRDLEPVWQDLRSKVSDAIPQLPAGVMGPYINDDFSDVYGVVLALTGDGYDYREIKDVADDLRDDLLKLDAVAKVELHGTQDERIFINVSNARMAEIGVGPMHVKQLLGTQNIVLPAGNALMGPERVVLEATGEFKSVKQIENTSLRIPGQTGTIYLSDVADVERAFVDPPRLMARFNNQPAIVLAVAMADGYNVIEMGSQVMAVVDELQQHLPIGLEFDLVSYQPEHVVRSVNEFMVNLSESFLMVALVVLIFAGLRTGLIVGTVVPLVMLMCLSIMPFFGVQIHRTSIGTLVLALGILVDNSVVISENILVRLQAGQDRMSAVRDAVATLSKPLLLASLCTILGFLPIYLAEGGVGKFCESLFIVMAITLTCSWILAQTYVPLVSYRFLKAKEGAQEFSGRLYSFYRGVLTWSLRHRPAFMTLVLLAMLGGIMLFKTLPSQFFPPNDRDLFMVEFRQPYGTDIMTTKERVSKLEQFLLQGEHVESVGSFIGYGGPRWNFALSMTDFGNNYARLIVNVDAFENLPLSMQRAQDFLDHNFPDLTYTLQELENGPPVGSPIQIRIAGDDIQTLYAMRDQIASIMQAVDGVINVRDDWGEWSKKLVIDVDQDKAKRAGFTSMDVALSLQTEISGLQVSEYREAGEIIPIMLRSSRAYREDVGKLDGLNVYSFYDGHSVPLTQIAATDLTWQPSNINRRDQQRTMTLKADVQERFASDALNEIMAGIEAQEWPRGYVVEYGGEYEQSSKATASVTRGLPIAFALITLILIFQFNSLRRPLIIWLTLPPMLIGIAIGLKLTGLPFSFFATLGCIALVGIIVSNAIILIDRIDGEQAEGRAAADAIVQASLSRIRPILMTAITTVVGMLPLYLAGGLWQPLAVAMISGLLFSTLLTLVLCPVLYASFFRVRF